MLIGHFTERPYQDPSASWWGHSGRQLTDLAQSNDEYDPVLGAQLYNRYLDEKVYAEEVGFDALALNEHHSTPFCMGGVIFLDSLCDSLRLPLNICNMKKMVSILLLFLFLLLFGVDL